MSDNLTLKVIDFCRQVVNSESLVVSEKKGFVTVQVNGKKYSLLFPDDESDNEEKEQLASSASNAKDTSEDDDDSGDDDLHAPLEDDEDLGEGDEEEDEEEIIIKKPKKEKIKSKVVIMLEEEHKELVDGLNLKHHLNERQESFVLRLLNGYKSGIASKSEVIAKIKLLYVNKSK